MIKAADMGPLREGWDRPGLHGVPNYQEVALDQEFVAFYPGYTVADAGDVYGCERRGIALALPSLSSPLGLQVIAGGINTQKGGDNLTPLTPDTGYVIDEADYDIETRRQKIVEAVSEAEPSWNQPQTTDLGVVIPRTSYSLEGQRAEIADSEVLRFLLDALRFRIKFPGSPEYELDLTEEVKGALLPNGEDEEDDERSIEIVDSKDRTRTHIRIHNRLFYPAETGPLPSSEYVPHGHPIDLGPWHGSHRARQHPNIKARFVLAKTLNK